MKKHIWEIALAVALAFFAAGVGGMVIEAVFHPTQLFWVSFWMAMFGFIASLVIIFRSQLFKAYKYLKSKVLLVWNVITHIKESNELLNLKEAQLRNPEKALYPVIEYVDLNRQGSLQNDNDAWVSFQIDSHLLFPLKDFYVSVQLCLKDTNEYEETESDWQNIPLSKNHAPIGYLERYRFCEAQLHFEEITKTGKDNTMLLELMKRFRHGKKIHAQLKVGIRFNENDKLDSHILEGNTPSFGINPINNYRGG